MDSPYPDCAFIVHAKEHWNRIALYAGAIDCSVDGALEDVICPSGHAICNVDHKGSLELETLTLEDTGMGSAWIHSPSLFLTCRAEISSS